MFAIFLVMSFFSGIHGISNQAQAVDVSADAVYLFTDPRSCAPCKKLEGLLKNSGEEQEVVLRIKGKDKKLPLIKIDPWPETEEIKKISKQLNINIRGIPFYTIFHNKKNISHDLVEPLENIDDLKIFFNVDDTSISLQKRLQLILDNAKSYKFHFGTFLNNN